MTLRRAFLTIVLVFLTVLIFTQSQAHSYWQYHLMQKLRQKEEAKVAGNVIGIPHGKKHKDSTPGRAPRPIPISNATVVIKGEKGYRTTQTDKEGYFQFKGLDPGSYIIEASKENQGSATVKFSVRSGQFRQLEPIMLITEDRIRVGLDGQTLPNTVYVVMSGMINRLDEMNMEQNPKDPFHVEPPENPHDSTRHAPQVPELPDSLLAHIENSDKSSSDNKLLIIDPTGNQVLEDIRIEGNPTWTWFNPLGSKLFVLSDRNNIQIFDVKGNYALVNRIALPAPVLELAMHPEGHSIFAICAGIPEVQEIDAKSFRVINTFTIPPSQAGEREIPKTLAFSPDGTKLVIAATSTLSAELVTYDMLIRNVSKERRLPIANNPIQTSFSQNGDKIYVLHRKPGKMTIINPQSFRIENTIPITGDPVRMAVKPDGSSAFVTCKGTNLVQVVQADPAKKTRTINVGREPTGIALSHDGNRVFVSNNADGTITVIDVKENQVMMNTKPYPGKHPMGIVIKP